MAARPWFGNAARTPEGTDGRISPASRATSKLPWRRGASEARRCADALALQQQNRYEMGRGLGRIVYNRLLAVRCGGVGDRDPDAPPTASVGAPTSTAALREQTAVWYLRAGLSHGRM